MLIQHRVTLAKAAFWGPGERFVWWGPKFLQLMSSPTSRKTERASESQGPSSLVQGPLGEHLPALQGLFLEVA